MDPLRSQEARATRAFEPHWGHNRAVDGAGPPGQKFRLRVWFYGIMCPGRRREGSRPS